MKRTLLVMSILILMFSAMNIALAQGGGDKDGDGIPDEQDECPAEAGPVETGGCPVPTKVPDSDGDGIPDDSDKCPTQAGPKENAGCPVILIKPTDTPSSAPNGDSNPPSDRDGDGVIDDQDRCPDERGSTQNFGCPDEPVDDPFVPPSLPIDGCFVTSASANNINVRKEANVGGEILGHLRSGVVYEAEGFVTNGTAIWYVVKNYVGSDGTAGYSAGTVLLETADCPSLDVPAQGDQDRPDSLDVPVDTPPTLCFLTVGFDAPTWSGGAPMASIRYASFYFESEPGEPLPAGTTAWGVISLAPFITLPDHNNIIAVAPNPAVYTEALNSGAPNTYNWPTLAGGIQSGKSILYRLTDDVGAPGTDGHCGPIVGEIDDVTTLEPSAGEAALDIPIDQYACTVTTSYDFVFAFNIAPGESIPVGTAPTAILHTSYASGSVDTWHASIEEVDGETLDYMVNRAWASLVRTGGTCGQFGPARR